MKRVLITALAICALAALLCVCTYAEDAAPGIYDVTVPDAYLPGNTAFSVELTPLYANGSAAASADCPEALASSSAFYADAEQLSVTVSGTDISAAYYLILAQDAEQTQEDTIRYIDLGVQSGNSVSFSVYPDKLEDGKTYRIYLAGNGGAKVEIGSFKYYVPVPPYTLGDVDDDGEVTADDALLTLQAVVGIVELDETQTLAANVDHDDDVTADDALMILQHVVGLIDELV